ncbi:hypothetical protein [Pedobacter aquatilis]|uniref:hypothetical protein n=1 Tax=Pedobacter aquatilis TaxID=351343 RepID=UPI00292F54CF|nr:hypothetical protein [Pedobacter aquatilis]
MSLSNNFDSQNRGEEEKKESGDDGKIKTTELDNDTYGHSPDASAFKRKDEPDEAHIDHLKSITNHEAINSSPELKNINLSKEDLSQGSASKEKGIGGKS